MEFEKICVFGLGYIGLPTASTFANHGIRVIGVDVNPELVATLRKGGLHIHEPGLRTLVLAGAELLLLLVGHAQFKALVPAEVAQLTPARRAVDAINGWPVNEWQAAGFEITRLGVSTAKPLV